MGALGLPPVVRVHCEHGDSVPGVSQPGNVTFVSCQMVQKAIGASSSGGVLLEHRCEAEKPPLSDVSLHGFRANALLLDALCPRPKEIRLAGPLPDRGDFGRDPWGPVQRFSTLSQRLVVIARLCYNAR